MEHCPTDEKLIAFALGRLEEADREGIHMHLDACATCQQVLAEAAHAFATAVTSPLPEDVDWNTTFQPGAMVAGRYVISRFVARGAMGEVYEAFDRDLSQRVALKTVASTACDNSRAAQRLKAEVQLARRVSHSNVCRIYDFGTHVLPGTGVQLNFLTMEFVEGETLGQRVRLGGALPLDEAREVARELLLALRAAHGAGVLHRDFKSDNVMLKLGAFEHSTAIVLDFGLARDVEQTGSVSQSTFVGTFGYMAPELLEGLPHSTASDIYAFGVVWFEMLTGQLPFEDATSPAQALKCLQAPPPAPSTLNPEVTPELDAVVLRCLARTPGDRFRTAAEVLDALEELMTPRGRQSAPNTFRTLEKTASELPSGQSASIVHSAKFWAALGFGVALLALGVGYLLHVPPRELAARQLERSADTAIPVIAPPTTVTPPLPVSPPQAPSADVTALPAPSAPVQNLAASNGTRTARRAEREPSRHGEPAPNASAVSSARPALDPPPADSHGTATFPAPSSSSAPLPAPQRSPQTPKPDWENPFGAADRPALMAGRSRSPT